MNPNQKTAIRLIATAQGEISIGSLRAHLGFRDTRLVTVLLGGCHRFANLLELDWKKLVVTRIEGARVLRTSYYKAGPLLRGEATE